MNLKEFIRDYGYMVRKPDIVLSSGKKYDIYFDIKGVMLDRLGMTKLVREFSQMLIKEFDNKPYSIVGMELGGAQLVQCMIVMGYYGVIIRKKDKEYGLRKRIEGRFLQQQVVIVDDVITSGNTVEEVRSLLAPEHNILGICCIIDRTKYGRRYKSLYKEKDFFK